MLKGEKQMLAALSFSNLYVAKNTRNICGQNAYRRYICLRKTVANGRVGIIDRIDKVSKTLHHKCRKQYYTNSENASSCDPDNQDVPFKRTETSTSFLNEHELKLVEKRKITFSSVFENRVNVYLKPVETIQSSITKRGLNQYQNKGSSFLECDSDRDRRNSEPSNVEPSNVESSNVESSNVEPSNVEPSNVEPSNVEGANVEPSNVEPSNVEPSNVEPSNVEPSNVMGAERINGTNISNTADISYNINTLNNDHALKNDPLKSDLLKNDLLKDNTLKHSNFNDADNFNNVNDFKGKELSKKRMNNANEQKRNLAFITKERYEAISQQNHMYIYDFEIYNISELSKYEPGEIVNVYFFDKTEIGIGLLNRKSNITVRLIQKDMKTEINDKFFIKKLYESIKRRFLYIYNINLYEYITSFNIRNTIPIFSKIVNSINDGLPGLVINVLDKTVFIRYDTLSIQKYSYLFEKEIDKIFFPTNIICKKIISKKEKRAQQGKEYIWAHVKGNDTNIQYIHDGLIFHNTISNESSDIFHMSNKEDITFLKNLSVQSILNINGHVGEYVMDLSLHIKKKKNSLNDKNDKQQQQSNYQDIITIILTHDVKNANITNKNISLNKCNNITIMYRQDILEELNNMSLGNLKFQLIIFNIDTNICYRRNSYTSPMGKRHTFTFKGIYKTLTLISEIMHRNGLLFVTLDLPTSAYHNFLNIVKCVFEKKKQTAVIVYEHSCNIEDNILSIDDTAWHSRSVCFRLTDSSPLSFIS